jgi:hypothetical protein
MDRAVGKLAERQHGVLLRAQVLDLGFTPDAIQHRLATGRWELVRAGVYRLPGTPRSWEQQLLAVVLGAGAGAVVSHRTAAALWGLAGFRREERFDVTIPRGRRARHPSGRIHRSLHLPPAHTGHLQSIPVTRPARTLVDLAGVVPAGRTERAIDNALAMGLVTTRELHAVTAELARPGRPGIALLRRLLDERGTGYVAPASELEARYLALTRSAGLPDPVRQHDIGDDTDWLGRTDYSYPPVLVLVELDSRRHHLSKLDFEADRARDNRRVAAGWRPLRFTWRMVTGTPEAVIDLLLRSGVNPKRQGAVRLPRLGR